MKGWSIIACFNFNDFGSVLSVEDKVLDRVGEAEFVRGPGLEVLGAEGAPHGQPAPVGEGGGARLPRPPVLEADLTVAPHRRHDGVEGVALEAGVGRPEVAAVHHEGQAAEVHVEHHEEGVGHREGLLGAAG